MKDSAKLGSTNTFPSQLADSIHKDLKGIRCEIKHFNKSSQEGKSSVSSDTIFTVFVTLSVFVLGIIIDRLLKWHDRLVKQEELREFFLYHAKRANEKLILKLKEAYSKFADETNIDTGIPSTPPKIISSDFQRLIHMNFEELFKSFDNKESLSKSLSYIEFVDKVQQEVNDFHRRVYEDSGQSRDDLKVLSDEYLSLLSKYANYERDNNPGYENSKSFKLIQNSIQTYYTELAGTRQIQKFHDNIVRAIQEHIVNNNEYKKHPLAKEIAEKGRNLSHAFSELKGKTKEITDQYKIYAGYMDEANKKLGSLIKDLK